LQGGAEPLQRPHDGIRVLGRLQHPKINIQGGTRVSMGRHGVSANEEEFNLLDGQGA